MLFKKLFGGGTRNDAATWPLDEVVAAIKIRFGGTEMVGEDGPLKVFGVNDQGVNFVIALLQTGPGSGKIAELGFLARFDGYPVTADNVHAINRNLTIAVASIEQQSLFLMAGLQVVGSFDETQFNLVIEAWRRDLVLCAHQLLGEGDGLSYAFPAARLDAARAFATNKAPTLDEDGFDALSAFLGGVDKAAEIEDDKRGLFTRLFSSDGSDGFTRKKTPRK